MSRHHSSEPGDRKETGEIDMKFLQGDQATLRCLRSGLVPSDEEYERFNRFYEALKPLLERFVAACCLCGQDAEECLQESALKIVEGLPGFVSDGTQGSLCCWLYQIVHSKAMNLRRAHSRHPTKPLGPQLEVTLPARDAGPETEYESHRLQELVQRLLVLLGRQLPQLTYRAFYMHWIGQHTISAIASELNLPPRQVTCRVYKAMRKFEKLLYEQMDSTGGWVGGAFFAGNWAALHS